MPQTNELQQEWEELSGFLKENFGEGEALDLDAIIYLIGVQELGQLHRRFKKDEKVQLMHIAICRLLEPYGYYEFSHYDDDKWPHYTKTENLPALTAGEQTRLIKEAILRYFKEKQVI